MQWIFLAIIAAICTGTQHVFSKKVLNKEHALEFVTTTTIIAAALSFIVFYNDFNFNFSGNLWILIYVKSTIISVGWLFIMKAFRHADISIVAPLSNITPLFLIILSSVFLGEVLSINQFFGVGMMIIGTYILQLDHKPKSLLEPFTFLKNKYSLYVLIASSAFAVTATIDKFLIKTVNYQTMTFLLLFFLAVNYFIALSYKYNGWKDIRFALKEGKFLLFLVSILLVASNIAFFAAISIPSAFVSLVLPIKRSSTLVATIFGGELFHEKNVFRRAVACIIIILGVILIII